MRRRVRILPDHIANQIAAGEVVERPASAVKELIENALDARATRIEVEIRNGGKTEVRVADDGHGMTRDDALLAIDRHATSKIEDERDLRAIRTLGFRGEALPSIAAVSKFQLETAPDSGEEGTRLKINGGRVVAVDEVARQPGTTVSVGSLFFNVPARAKFLRSAAAETRAISETTIALALANLGASFLLRSNGREVLDLPRTLLKANSVYLPGKINKMSSFFIHQMTSKSIILCGFRWRNVTILFVASWCNLSKSCNSFI